MKKHLIGFLFLTAIASCVPQQGKNKATCSFGEEFNSLSQSCENVRSAPATSLELVTLTEGDDPLTVQLLYRDANNDQASACKVYETFAQFEAFSPYVTNGLFTESQNLYNEAFVANSFIESILGTGTGSATFLANAANNLSFLKAANTNTSFSTFSTALATQVNSIASIALANSSTASVGLSLSNLVTTFTTNIQSIDNRCQCTGGECYTVIAPYEGQSGTFGFQYEITDQIDGTGPRQEVEVQIAAVNDAPKVTDLHASLSESTDSSATSTVLNFSGVISDSDGFPVSVEVVQPALGNIVSCAIPFSVDLQCTYITPNGSSNGQGSAASLIVSDVTFTSRAYGASSNSISVDYEEISLPNFNASVDVQVSGSDITVYFINNERTASEVVSAINSDPLASRLVVASVSGTSSNLQTNAIARQNLSGGVDGFTSFQYRVLDNSGAYSEYATVSIDIVPNDDAPILASTGTFSPSSVLEKTSFTYVASFSDEEGDDVVASCLVTEADEFFIEGCTCDNAVDNCTVSLRPRPGTTGSQSFKVEIQQNGLPTNNSIQTVSVTVNELTEKPFLVNESQTGSESSTSAAVAFDLNTLSDIIDDDTGFTYTYNIVTAPTNGSLSNCALANSGTTQKLSCTYTPANGNIAGTGVAGVSDFSFTLASPVITATANSAGTWVNGVTVKLIDQTGLIGNQATFQEYAEIDGLAIEVYIDSGVSTCKQVKQALDANSKIASILTTSCSSDSTVVVAMASSESFTSDITTAATNGADSFTYTVSDGVSTSELGYININITDVDDSPLLCQYSSFKEAPECNNLTGCIGTTTPIGSITPATVGIQYYDTTTALCYRSSGTSSSSDWTIVTGSGLDNVTVTQREKAIIKRIRVDEGGGSIGGSEDSQQMILTSRSSSNTTLIPSSDFNIKVLYDGNEVTDGVAFETTTSSDLKDIEIQVTPVASLTGSSDITLVFTDGVTSLNTTFTVTVNSISANHGDWKNIKALGPTIDKNDVVKNQSYACTYSESGCSGGAACTGSGAPSSISADDANAVYYDSTGDACYISTAAGNASWTQINTYCQISPAIYATGCTGESCIGTSSPSGSITPSKLDVFFYDKTSETCYRSTGTTNTDWQTYNATGSVFLDFDAFSVSGGALVGYNVYRRAPFEEFDYETPINKSVVSTSLTYYEDNSTNSWTAPIPGTLYFYEVRPIVQDSGTGEQFSASTSEVFSTVRVIVPHDNKALVHRWIANKTMCEKLQLTPDPSNDYRCTYEGLGDTGLTPGSNFYDFSRDLIVSKYEAGCPYSASPTCTFTADGTCLGINDPTGSAVDGSIYYSRSSGKCFVRSSGAWNEFDGTQTLTGFEKSELPPLTNITQVQADTFCATQQQSNIVGVCGYSSQVCMFGGGTTLSDCKGSGAPSTLSASVDAALINATIFYFDDSTNTCYSKDIGTTGNWTAINPSLDGFVNQGSTTSILPSRKDQMVFGEWYLVNPNSTETPTSGKGDMTDSTAAAFEEGLGLNVGAKCNSSNANGLETNYTDSDSPNSNSLYTLPGTSTSGIRSVMTGSYETNACVTKYGIQDFVGNVSEWSSDRMLCEAGNAKCSALSDSDDAAGELISETNSLIPGDGSESYTDLGSNIVSLRYRFDGAFGPCDVNTGPDCDTDLTSWFYRNKTNQASRFSIPLGLPVDTQVDTTLSGTSITPYLSLIGSSAGISLAQLKDDIIKTNMATIRATGDRIGGFVGGGSYLDGEGAGTYFLEMLPTDSTSQRTDVGVRCVTPSGGYME